MRKPVLFTLAATLLLVQACKKKPDTIAPDPSGTDSVQVSYPAKYVFLKAGDLSAVLTYDSTGQVNAPNHPSALEPYIVHLQDSVLAGTDRDLAGDAFTLLSPTRMKYSVGSFDTTFNYIRSGNRLFIPPIYSVQDTAYFDLSADGLRYPFTFCLYADTTDQGQVYTSTQVGFFYRPDPYHGFELANSGRTHSGFSDTIAVRNYNLIFKKQS